MADAMAAMGFSQMDVSSAVDGLIASAQGAAAPMMDKALLVQRVKDWQRKGADQKEQWWAYCKASGNTNFDPGRHEAPFLQGFFDFVEGRAPMPTKGSSKGGGGGAKMFMGGLPKSTTEEKVWEVFGYYGTIKEVMLKYSDEGQFRGFGFVIYEDPASVQAAIAGTNDNMIDGKWIDCKNSDEISKGAGKGGGKGGGKGKDGGKGKKGGKGGGKGKDWGDMWSMMATMMAMMKGKKGGKKGDSSGGGKGDGPKPGDWTCPNCGDTVFARNKECRMCGTAKPADAGGGGGASWGGGGGQSWGGGGGAAASTAEFKPGDWECPQCGNHCFSSRSSCKKCGYTRNAAAAAEANKARMRPGDWTCTACGDLVFAKKTSCGTCGMGKPIEEPQPPAMPALPGFGAMPATMGNAYPAAAMLAAMGHPGPY